MLWILLGLCSLAGAAPQTMMVDEIFSPDMFWSNGIMVVLEGVRFAADSLEGDEDRQVCELLADEFEGEEATVEILREVQGPDHPYLIGVVRVGKVDMNDRAEDIIAEVIGGRDYGEDEAEEAEEADDDGDDEGEEG